MKRILFILIALLALAAGAYFLIFGQESQTAKMSENAEKVEMVFRAYDGAEVRLSTFRGTPVLVNLWASWCPYCKDEFRDFVSIQEELGDRVKIIAANRGERPETAKAYSDGLSFTEKLIFLLDADDTVYKKFGGFSMPETIFIDKDGFIKEHKRGPMDRLEMRRRIQSSFGI